MEYKVLDKGFVRVVDTMGDDSSIVQAARVSYGKGVKTPEEDKKLILFLMRNKHTSPFEMCEIKLHIKAPLFIVQQWLRHRTANVNQFSGRYSEFSDDFYIPTKFKKQSKENKQCRDEKSEYSDDDNAYFSSILQNNNMHSYQCYQELLENGVAKEMARSVLPQNIYTQFYWKIDLHNYLNFIRLRTASDAQFEIRCYAFVLEEILKGWCPTTYAAYLQYT